ncbi:MAG: hypothetical protein JW940_26850 [Polyangiaceae bacterium]|nr:hypothetical protein [Polyangiaceae bacterium]
MTRTKTGSMGRAAVAVLASAFAVACGAGDDDTEGAAGHAGARATEQTSSAGAAGALQSEGGSPGSGGSERGASGAAGSAQSGGGAAGSGGSERSASGAAGAAGDVSKPGADAGAGGAGAGTNPEAGGVGGKGTAGAAGATGSGPDPLPLDVMGVWADSYGGYHRITEAVWTQSGFGDVSRFNIAAYDNDARVIIAQNDAENAYNPGKYSRFDWTEYDGSVWYCTTVYDAATRQEASDAARADDTDPSTGGCGSFPWSELIPPAIVGRYADDWGGTHEVDPYRWIMGSGASASVFVFTQFDNDAMYAIAENDEDNEYSPGRWSRFDWTEYEGELYYCSTAYDAAAEQDALDTPRADDTDPTSGGCGSFPWSRLIEE